MIKICLPRHQRLWCSGLHRVCIAHESGRILLELSENHISLDTWWFHIEVSLCPHQFWELLPHARHRCRANYFWLCNHHPCKVNRLMFESFEIRLRTWLLSLLVNCRSCYHLCSASGTKNNSSCTTTFNSLFRENRSMLRHRANWRRT